MSKDIDDVNLPVLVVFKRSEFTKSFNTELIPKNTGKLHNIDIINNNRIKVPNFDLDTILAYKNILINKDKNKYHKRQYNIDNIGIEGMTEDNDSNKFPVRPYGIYILLTKENRNLGINSIITELRNKYPKTYITVVDLRKSEIPRKSPETNSLSTIFNYISMGIAYDLIVGNPKLNNEFPNKMSKIYDMIDYGCPRYLIVANLPRVRYMKINKSLARFVNSTSLIAQKIHLYASKEFVTYGACIGRKYLLGYGDEGKLSNKSNRDKKLNIENKHFYNVDEFCINIGCLFAFQQGYENVWKCIFRSGVKNEKNMS